jgi:hypothetical protein
MDAYTLSLVDHGLEEREREIAWLDRLIAAERVGSREPPIAEGPARTDPAPDRPQPDPLSGPAARRAARRARRDAAAGERAGKRGRGGKRPRAPRPAEGTNDTTGTRDQADPGTRAERDGPPPGAIAQTRRTNG